MDRCNIKISINNYSWYDKILSSRYSYTNSVAYYFLMIAMLGISNHGNRSIAAARYDKEKLNRTFYHKNPYFNVESVSDDETFLARTSLPF